MERATENMYEASLEDKEFEDEIKSSDPENYIKPNWRSTPLLKAIYVSVYYGWLVGKGRFTEGMFN